MNTHPFIRYGEAVVRYTKRIDREEPLTNELIAQVLEGSLTDFRVRPYSGHFAGSNQATYRFDAIEKGDPGNGIFLAPNVLSSDKAAGNTWKATWELVSKLRQTEANSEEKAQMSFMPLSGEFLSFGSSGSIGRGKSSLTLQEAGLAAITTLTRVKPALHYRKINESPVNTALIPDLELPLLLRFLELLKEMQKIYDSLLVGKRLESIEGKKTSVKLQRPGIYSGNFPGAPRSSAMCGLALLASIGEAVQRVEKDERAKFYPLLDALRTAPVYLVQYGDASVMHFNHYVVDMAREGELRPIIDSAYYIHLHSVGRRTPKNFEYQKLDFFYSRFLQLFTEPAFQDFMSFRSEYPVQLTPLFITYFTQHPMEKISPEIVESARVIGRWINDSAYRRARADLKEKHGYPYAELLEAKAKYLIGIESMVFSAKEGHDIIGQLAVTLGRATNEDFPAEATLFFEKVATSELSTKQAQNLLMAFSRISAFRAKPVADTADAEPGTTDPEREESAGAADLNPY